MHRATIGIVLALLVAACSKPYATPKILADDAGESAFLGIADLARQTGTLNATWIHGMCHHPLDWATGRAAQIAQALGGEVTVEPEFDGDKRVARGQVQAAGAVMNIDFLYYSADTEPEKKVTQSISASFADLEQASLNAEIKATMMDDCFVDVVVYLGQNGQALRHQMRRAVCAALGGTQADGSELCVFTAEGPARNRVFLTESLGTKVLFDAVRCFYKAALVSGDAPQAQALVEQLRAVQYIYFLSNQLPLLDRANQPRGSDGDICPDVPGSLVSASRASAGGSLSDVLSIRSQDDRAVRSLGPQVKSKALPPPLTVVSFTDPSDLLSYALPQSTIATGGRDRIVNVIVSNETTYFGLIQDPLGTHLNYDQNPSVIELLIEGYDP